MPAVSVRCSLVLCLFLYYVCYTFPVPAGSQDLSIDWLFVEKVNTFQLSDKKGVLSKQKKDQTFVYDVADFQDAVVMPSYRNIDQPQHFYVAEIRQDLTPLSPFPSPELYKTFQVMPH